MLKSAVQKTRKAPLNQDLPIASKDPAPKDPALISPQRGVVIGFRYIVLVLVLVLEQNHASRTRTSTRTNWHDIVFKIKFWKINPMVIVFQVVFNRQSSINNLQSYRSRPGLPSFFNDNRLTYPDSSPPWAQAPQPRPFIKNLM